MQSETILQKIETLEADSLSDYQRVQRLQDEVQAAVKECKEVCSRMQVNRENATFSRAPNALSNLGTSSPLYHEKSPVFKDEPFEKPIRFLNELKKYLDFIKPDTESLNYYFSKSLDGEAKTWWYVVQDKIATWEDFENEFRDQYWNSIFQQNLHWKVGHITYYSNSKITRVQYATQVLSIGQDLGLLEATVLSMLPTHFERNIKLHLMKYEIFVYAGPR